MSPAARAFDWALFELYNEGRIPYAEAIRTADSANEVRLNIKFKSQRDEPATAAAASMSMHEMASAEDERAAHLLRQDQRRRELE